VSERLDVPVITCKCGWARILPEWGTETVVAAHTAHWYGLGMPAGDEHLSGAKKATEHDLATIEEISPQEMEIGRAFRAGEKLGVNTERDRVREAVS